MSRKIITSILFIIALQINAQDKTTTLKANCLGNTYELIDCAFAPLKGTAVESPGFKTNGCDNHSSYVNQLGGSDHITEVLDAQMGPVFKFSIHTEEDRDRHKCQNTDRQRNEIKTYRSSPEYLKANIGETVEYKWTMKLPHDFQVSSSFTHLHQIKSVGGIKAEEKIPLITFTAFKKEKGDVLDIRYSETTTQKTIAKIPLNEFRGQWVQFTETIEYKNKKGSYHLEIKNSNHKILLDYNDKIKTYKTDADLMRPKWGIYRSLKSAEDLKDEDVLFGYFKITEYDSVIP